MAFKTPTGRSGSVVGSLETDEQTAHRIADHFAEASPDVAVALVDGGNGRWRVAIHFDGAHKDLKARVLAAAGLGLDGGEALRFTRVAAKDWINESLAALKPVAAGRFVVHGAHDRSRVAANRIGIEIEAALAFGTGHHGTTLGCLLALDRICKTQNKKSRASPVLRHPELRAKRDSDAHLRMTVKRSAPGRILDLGTGSGVLAIAAARALRRPVLATDIDAGAARVASANARLNRVGGLVAVVKADGVAAHIRGARADFDLVFANILLRPLQRLAAPLMALTAPGGRIVLSGLLSSQASAALAAYRALALERRIDLDGWTTLVLTRRTRRHGDVSRRRLVRP